MGCANIAWYGDKHKFPAWPDMKMIRGYPELGIHAGSGADGLCLDLKLAPEGIDIFLFVVHAGEFHQIVPDGRVRAVSPDHEVELDLDFLATAAVLKFEPGFPVSKVSPLELMAEEEAHIWHIV